MFAFILGLRFLALRNAKGRERPEPGFCLGVRESGWRPVRVPSTSLHNLVAAVGLANLTVFLIRGVSGLREGTSQQYFVRNWNECALERVLTAFDGPKLICNRAGSTDRSACGCRDWQTSGSHDPRHFGGLCGPQMTSLMRKDDV